VETGMRCNYFAPLLKLLLLLLSLYPQKLAITSPTRGGRSVGIVRSKTQTMEFVCLFIIIIIIIIIIITAVELII
jgi:hypothetical protein